LIKISHNEASLALALVVLFTLLFAPPSDSATKTIRSPIYGILTGSGIGGCAIQIGAIPNSTGLSCRSGDRSWLTLDCAGYFGKGRVIAHNNLDTARTALLTDSRLTVTIDDSLKVGGYCYANTLILFR
jgi:hypothetical protein